MTATRYIAGHAFDSRGFCTTALGDGTLCGRRWLDIRNCDGSYVHEQGWAHSGALSIHEVNQIMAEKKREDGMFEAAISGREELTV
jgi:hypothetical protein